MKILHKYLRPEYEAIAAKNNQKVLYMVPWPTQYLHLKVKADTLDGLKGVKIRVPDKNAQDMCAAVGMAPVLIPWGETIPALASGAVAGVSTSSVSGVDGKFWEFLKYVYPTNHTWSCQMVNVNNDTWKKLTPAQQKAIEDLGKKLEPDFWVASLKADTDSLKRLTDGGMEVVQIPPAMMKDFQAKTAPLLDAFLKRVPASEKPVKAFLAEVKRSSVNQSLNAAAPWPLRLLLDGIERLARLDGWIGAACLITLTLLMLAEITVRALSNFISWVPADIPVAWEYSSYLMAACFTFGAAMTLRAGGHIRVTLVLGRLQPPARRLLEIAASLVAMCSSASSPSRWRVSPGPPSEQARHRSPRDTLLWIPESVIAFGMVLLALQFLARFIQALLGLPLEDHRIKAAPVECDGRHHRHDVRDPVLGARRGHLDRPDARRNRRGDAGAVPQHPARQAARAVCLEHPHHAGTARAADVHPDGRDPVPVAPVALAVPGARAMGRAAAGPAAARERGRLLDLRGDLRLLGRDHAGGRPHGARRTVEARLFEGHRDRQRSPAPARSAS